MKTEDEPTKKSIDTDFGDFSASLGATYNLNEKVLLRANYASVFKTPNITELTQNGILMAVDMKKEI